MSKVWRWCLDLNIWYGAFLAKPKLQGHEGSACQFLVNIAANGKCDLAKVDLIISFGMLNRLYSAFIRHGIPEESARFHIDLIQTYAALGPSLTLGGTGILPLNDLEDRHVLETALAGKADLLITINHQDFLTKEVSPILPEYHYLYQAPNHRMQIVHPFLLCSWFRQTSPFLDPENLSFPINSP